MGSARNSNPLFSPVRKARRGRAHVRNVDGEYEAGEKRVAVGDEDYGSCPDSGKVAHGRQSRVRAGVRRQVSASDG